MALTGKSYRRASLVFLHDMIMACLALVVALWLRLDAEFATFVPPALLAQWLALFAVSAAGVFWLSGLYRGVWRYASVEDLVQLAKATTALLAVFMIALFLVSRLDLFPRSVVVIVWVVLMVLLGAPRLLYRYLKDGRIDFKRSGPGFRRVLLVGTDDEADQFIRAARRAGGLEVVGMLALAEGRVGREFGGVRILGEVRDVARVVAALKARGRAPDMVVLASERLSGPPLAALVAETEALELPVARPPRPTDLERSDGGPIAFKPVALEDLLGRSTVSLDRDGMAALIRGRRVLVTGAGGSIGSELVRRIAGFEPALLVLAEASELALYTIDMELAEAGVRAPRVAALVDVRDRERVEALLATHRPELVFHAAALKHVPLVEANPLAGLWTNAIGTRVLADACVRAGVGTMVVVSTDKAVNPTNVMGASKRAAEIYTQALDLDQRARGGTTRFVTVRFGNVLGSTGSVVPLFERQLKAGGPLTVTDPDVKRYFMTIPEAVDLVLQASLAGTRSEEFRGRIFVLEMGQPIRIADLARQMIRLSGQRPDIDVKIAYTGLRPGEKLFEELFHGEEPPIATGTAGVLLAAARSADLADAAEALRRMEAAIRADDAAAALAELRRLVPEFQPAG